MSAHEAGFESDDPALDEVFEQFGPVDVDAFIDSQFNFALGGEEDRFGSSQQDGSKGEAGCSPTDAMLDSFGSDTHMSLEGAIPLSPEEEPPSNRLICSLCRENMEKNDMESFCGISELSTTTGDYDAQRKPRVCDGGIELKETTTKLRDAVVTELQLSDISDDVGTCWRVLGPKLEIAAAKLQNLDEEYKFNRDRANALLLIWRQKEGSCATVGRLADFLVHIGRKSIAEKLLGVSDVLMPSFTTVSRGEVISLTVKGALNAELDSKLLLCEDVQGNKFMLKPCNSNGTGWNPQEIQKNSRFLETVAAAAEEMGKTSEQRRQESLKRISTEVQELRRQLKRIKLDCNDTEPCHMISEPKENREPSKEMPNDGNTPHQDAECLLHSCEEQRTFCQGVYDSLIKLIGEVAQLRDHNFMCIKELCDFTKELKDKEKTFFSKINQLRDMKQQLNLLQVAQLEELEKWSRTQKDHIEGVEKLLSILLHQGKSQKLQKRRSEPVLSGKSSPHAFGRMRSKTDSSKNPKSQSLSELSDDNRKNKISGPVCVRRICLMDTDKKLKK